MRVKIIKNDLTAEETSFDISKYIGMEFEAEWTIFGVEKNSIEVDFGGIDEVLTVFEGEYEIISDGNFE